MGVIRLLFLADTHLGFDYPFRPRIDRRRRGEDFFANYTRALEPAFKGKVDAIIHGGDLLFRSKVPARLVDMALSPLKEAADKGVDVFVVPGNHERSRIPFWILSMHPFIHIFDVPRTFILERRGIKLGIAGFPYWRDNVRARFPLVCGETGWKEKQNSCDGMILCVHHCFEGATVGPGNYTFRNNDDVIRIKDVPEEFLAVLSGHIHRFQVLTRDLQGKSVKTPILYPGSIERTSFAEKDEPKCCLKIELRKNEGVDKEGMNKAGRLALSWEFVKLPARPMVRVHISADGLSRDDLKDYISHILKELDPESVVKLHMEGQIREDALSILRAKSLRALSPSQMNVSLRFSQSIEKQY
ncbi:MAG: metallophosphoesterase [Candidatus Aminicenantaceae bacterium]